MDTDFAPALDHVNPQDSGWGLLTHMGDAVRRDETRSRAEALQMLALTAVQAGDAQSACLHLVQSLDVATGMDPEEALRCLSALKTALVALDSGHCAEGLRIATLCQQVALARELGLAGRRATDRAAFRH